MLVEEAVQYIEIYVNFKVAVRYRKVERITHMVTFTHRPNVPNVHRSIHVLYRHSTKNALVLSLTYMNMYE